MRKLLLITCILLQACTMAPSGLQTIETLDTQRYMGTWYEIARLDHSFERNLQQVTAEYSLRDDGGIKVINKGFNAEKKEWKEAEGRAYFREDKPNGKIKVSFFWPFYGGYNIVELDNEYQHVLIIGPDPGYAWILARQPNMPAATYEALVAKAKTNGVAEQGWIKVNH